MYMYMYIYILKYTYVYICMYTCIERERLFAHRCMYIRMYIDVCTYVCMYVCMYVINKQSARAYLTQLQDRYNTSI